LSILVVGGAGYIGSHAARALRRQGYQVLIYDNLSRGHAFLADGFELVVGDIADRSQLSHVMRRVDAVMHFAASSLVGESVENPKVYFQNNVEAGLTLINAALEAGVRKFIFSSTCAVYGIPEKTPITEDTPRQPVNPYGMSKLFFENALESYDRAYGLRHMTLRYFNAAGADESGEIGELHDPETHLIPAALKAVTGERGHLELFGSDYPTPDGTCIRDYIHVSDLAAAHITALDHLMAGGSSNAFNAGTGQGYTVMEVLHAVEEATQKRVPYTIAPRREGDPAALVADAAKLRRVLGWEPRRSGLRDIVRDAWAYHQFRFKKS